MRNVLFLRGLYKKLKSFFHWKGGRHQYPTTTVITKMNAATQMFMQFDVEYKHESKRRARYEILHRLYTQEFDNDQSLFAQYEREISEQSFAMDLDVSCIEHNDTVMDLDDLSDLDLDDLSSMDLELEYSSSMDLDMDRSMYISSLTSIDTDLDYDDLEKGTYYEYSTICELAMQLGCYGISV